MTGADSADVRIGTARASPGESARGYLDVTELPTGVPERLPVIVANGAGAGPTLWITGSIHGDEVTGLAVAQDAMAEDLHDRIRGRVICLPNLNPAGLRRTERTSYYHDDDPNRYFPDPEDGDGRSRPPRVQQLIDDRLYALLAGEDDEAVADRAEGPVAADALISLHTAGVGSVPFNIRDRVRYGGDRTEEEARELAAETDRLIEAFGIPVVTTYDPGEQEDQDLHRAIAGAALNGAGVPAFTPELGSHSVVEERNREAGVVGTRNVMREMDMLPGDPEPNEATPEKPVEYPVKRHLGPHTPTPGIARHRVEAGDPIEEGDPIADIVTPHGEHRTTVRAEREGYVLGRSEGVAVYENDPLARLAVPDDGDAVVPWDGE